MLEATTVSVSIDRHWRAVYDTIWEPTFFPRWASGLGGSLEPDGADWRAEGPDGPVRIRFTGHNALGVMDHHVDLADGTTVSVPMRVIANGDGAEVMLTLFRQPRMSAERHRADLAWVRRDLDALRALLEGGN